MGTRLTMIVSGVAHISMEHTLHGVKPGYGFKT